MIISKNINPKKDLYYLWAIIIDELNNSENFSNDFFKIYKKIKDLENIKINLYILALDWLFLLNIIEYNNSVIKLKCLSNNL